MKGKCGIVNCRIVRSGIVDCGIVKCQINCGILGCGIVDCGIVNGGIDKHFFYLWAKCWNILPKSLRFAESPKQFSNALKNELLHSIEIYPRYVVDNTYDLVYKLHNDWT